jgi:hypothetical protein
MKTISTNQGLQDTACWLYQMLYICHYLIKLYEYVKKYINKKERTTPTWLLSADIAGARGLRWKKMKYCSFQPALRPSSGDEGRSAGWKLQYFIFFHCNPQAPAMSADSSQVGVVLFPSY